MPKRKKYIPLHSPHIAGFPKVYQIGDMVKTRDGSWGVVVDFTFHRDLILYTDDKPSQGFFTVKVKHDGYTAEYLRHDLSGKRLSGGFW